MSNNLSEVSFSYKGNQYILNSLILKECLELPCSNCDAMSSKSDIKNMLENINYVVLHAKSGKIIIEKGCLTSSMGP